MKLCEEWRFGTTTLRQAEAELERLQMSRRVGFVEVSCLCMNVQVWMFLIFAQRAVTVAALRISPMKDGLHQFGRRVQAPSDGANMFESSLAFSSHFVLNSESLRS